MKTYLTTTACAAVLCAAHPAWGQGAPPTPDVAGAEAARAVSELIVTATRSPQDPARIGQSVTVLNQKEIAASQAVLVSDLISQMAGVAYSRNGGPGGVTSIRIRGAESDQTLAVVDGVKINDPSAPGGGYNFANLLTGEVARIEVLRGAQSTLWGSQAIGGVVNIVTTEPSAPFEASLQAEAGSLGEAYARAAAGGAGDHLVWRLSASRHVTDGVSAFARGTESDGYETTGLSGRARVMLSDHVSLDLRAVWTDSRNDFDGFPAPTFAFADTAEYGTTKEFVGYGGLNFALFDGRLQNRMAYGYTDTDRQLFNPAQAVTTLTFDAVGQNERWEYQGAWAITTDWNATFGAETERASMQTASFSAFNPNPVPATAKARIDSLYGQVQGEVAAGLTLTAGLRRDSHDTFGDHTLGQLAAAWLLNDGATVLRAGFGQGFKAPTLFQLFSTFGNLGLAPESADAWDAGVQQTLADGKVVVSATGFARETENQIDFVSCTFGSALPICRPGGVSRFGYFDNIARTKAHGVELEGRAELGGLEVQANYSWTHTENDAAGSPNRGKPLARRPEHQANLAATYRWPQGLSTTGAVRYVGASFDNAANSFTLQNYVLVDLRAAYPVTESLEVYGRIENALDERYQTARDFGVQGRTAAVGLRARF